jgi:hypothetical protein
MNKKHFSIYLFISLSLFISQFSIATVRFVSKAGSSTPPYTTWAIASDSIQKCINICLNGDTVYVGNGVYKEMVRVYPGKTLIGAGWDSCIIDTRDLIDDPQDNALVVDDNTNVEGFLILTSTSQIGTGIYINYAVAQVRYMKIRYAGEAIYMFNSSPLVEGNIIENCGDGIQMEAFTNNYFPILKDNFIYYPLYNGITKTFGTCPKIYNNIIFLNNEFNRGIFLGSTDSISVCNNLIFSTNAQEGISNPDTYTINYNNYLEGIFSEGAIFAQDFNVIENNILTNGNMGIRRYGLSTPAIIYNNSWNNTVNYNFLPDSTNLSVNPMVVNRDSLDFHLQKYSPAIDAGDPSILDRDGSRSDIGLYGGPYGEKYTYRDLAPKPPSNVTAVYENKSVKLKWNRNTEADFSHYRIYRDTVAHFIYDTTKIVGVTNDTTYSDNLPINVTAKNYYYLLTALDNTNHQSAPSEEVIVIVTGMNEVPPKVVEEYKLLNNYPNPFNSTTKIPYRLKESGHVKLVIYDIRGEKVKVLVDEYQQKGYYEVEFSPTYSERKRGETGIEYPTGYNNDIASGMYIYYLNVQGHGDIPVFTSMGKMVLLK